MRALPWGPVCKRRLSILLAAGALAFFFAAALRGAAFFTTAFAFFFTTTALATLAFVTRPLSRLKIAAPSSAGERTVVTRAASSAANLSAAVPLPPEMTAPA